MMMPGGQFVSNLGSLAAASTATACCAYRATRTSDRPRRTWALLAVGTGFWSLGQAGWAFNELVRHIEVPFPSWSDLGFLALVPLGLAGMVSMVSTARGGTRALLDALIITGSVFYLSWALVLGPVFHGATHTTIEQAVTLAYPIGDIILASMVFIMLGHAARIGFPAMTVLALGFLSLAIGDSGFAYLVQQDAYHTGSIVDTGWFNGFVLIAIAAVLADDRPTTGRDERSLGRLALPYVPLAVALAASVTLRILRGPADLVLYTVELLVVVLVVLRQLVGLRDNVLLTRRLSTAVDELRRGEIRLRHMALHDSLTGLPNRAAFTERTESALAAQDRHGGHLAVLYIDLNGFKAVNDTHGHAAGDALLVAAGDRIRDCLRIEDTVARLGGDEFAVLTMLDADADDTIVARIAATLSVPFVVPTDSGPVTATVSGSVGMAVRSPGGPDAETLLRQADRAMYATKHRGADQFAVLPNVPAS